MSVQTEPMTLETAPLRAPPLIDVTATTPSKVNCAPKPTTTATQTQMMETTTKASTSNTDSAVNSASALTALSLEEQQELHQQWQRDERMWKLQHRLSPELQELALLSVEHRMKRRINWKSVEQNASKMLKHLFRSARVKHTDFDSRPLQCLLGPHRTEFESYRAMLEEDQSESRISSQAPSKKLAPKRKRRQSEDVERKDDEHKQVDLMKNLLDRNASSVRRELESTNFKEHDIVKKFQEKSDKMLKPARRKYPLLPTRTKASVDQLENSHRHQQPGQGDANKGEPDVPYLNDHVLETFDPPSFLSQKRKNGDKITIESGLEVPATASPVGRGDLSQLKATLTEPKDTAGYNKTDDEMGDVEYSGSPVTSPQSENGDKDKFASKSQRKSPKSLPVELHELAHILGPPTENYPPWHEIKEKAGPRLLELIEKKERTTRINERKHTGCKIGFLVSGKIRSLFNKLRQTSFTDGKNQENLTGQKFESPDGESQVLGKRPRYAESSGGDGCENKPQLAQPPKKRKTRSSSSSSSLGTENGCERHVCPNERVESPKTDAVNNAGSNRMEKDNACPTTTSSLSQEMRELARLIEEIKLIGASKRAFDWNYIKERGSTSLIGLVEKRRKEVRQFDKNALRNLLGDQTEARKEFEALRLEIRRQPKYDRLKHKKPSIASSRRHSVPNTKMETKRATRASLKEDNQPDKSLKDNPTETRKPRDSVQKLPYILSELAVLWEFSAQDLTHGPNWKFIEERACSELMQHIQEKRGRKQLFMEDPILMLIPVKHRSGFSTLRKRIQRDPSQFIKFIPKKARDSADDYMPGNEKADNEKDNPIARSRGPKDKNLIKHDLLMKGKVTWAGVHKLFLSSDEEELARLIVEAKERGAAWGYVESHASTTLSALIREVSQQDPNYFDSPLSCLIPPDRTSDFNAFIKSLTDDNEEVAAPPPVAGAVGTHTANDGNDEDDKDGDAWKIVLEQYEAIQTFVGHMKREMCEFESAQIQKLRTYLK